MTKSNNNGARTIGVKLAREHLEKLEKLQKWYRTNRSYTIRNLIDDAYRSIRKGATLEGDKENT